MDGRGGRLLSPHAEREGRRDVGEGAVVSSPLSGDEGRGGGRATRSFPLNGDAGRRRGLVSGSCDVGCSRRGGRLIVEPWWSMSREFGRCGSLMEVGGRPRGKCKAV
jgi:hypothetical protein